jgi:hypothetical protein
MTVKLHAATLLDGYFEDGRERRIMLATLEMDFTVVVYGGRNEPVSKSSSSSLQHGWCRRNGHDWNPSGACSWLEDL